MYSTVLLTGPADIGAQLAHLLHKLAIQLHHTHGHITDHSTLMIQPDTGPQGMHIIFFQAGIGALPAHRRAIHARIDTNPVLCIWNN
jgi:hypothetical protein